MENTSIFTSTSERVLRILPKLCAGTAQMLFAYQHGHQQEAAEMAVEQELLAEKVVMCYRLLPTHSGSPNARMAVEENMANAIPVEIGFTQEGWFSLRIPRLLPRKERKRSSPDYIRGYLYPAMQRFFKDTAPVRYADCVIIYRHIYARSEPSRRYRDHDNIESNFVTDTIAAFVLPDDGPFCCQHHHCSAHGEKERTEVYVVPEADFTKWYEASKFFPDEGVKLYEHLTI